MNITFSLQSPEKILKIKRSPFQCYLERVPNSISNHKKWWSLYVGLVSELSYTLSLYVWHLTVDCDDVMLMFMDDRLWSCSCSILSLARAALCELLVCWVTKYMSLFPHVQSFTRYWAVFSDGNIFMSPSTRHVASVSEYSELIINSKHSSPSLTRVTIVTRTLGGQEAVRRWIVDCDVGWEILTPPLSSDLLIQILQ